MAQSQETLASLSRAIAQNPGEARTLAQRGEAYRLLGYYQEALADFKRSIDLKPDYAWAMAHRGETYYLLKQYQAALTDFKRAIELDPTYAWAIAHRGLIYKSIKQYEEALADFDRAVELKPDYAWVVAHRGSIYMIIRRYEKALTDFDRVIDLDETLINHWRGERGLILNALGRYPETIVCCEQALQENPDDYIALYSLVVAKSRGHGFGKSPAEIERTWVRLQTILQTALDSHLQATALYRLGGLAALEDKPDQALTYLQQAIPLDNEPGEAARHDPAWLNLRTDPRFQALIVETIYEKI